MLWAQAYLGVVCASVPIFFWKTATWFLLKSGKKEAQSQESISYGMRWSIKYQYLKKDGMESQINSEWKCIHLYRFMYKWWCSAIMFLHSTTKNLYQCLVSCMYNLGEVAPIIFNSLSIKSNSPKEVFIRHFTVLRDGRGPRVMVSSAAFHVKFRKTEKNSSPSTCESQYCGEHPWSRGSVLGLRPPGLEFRILCLEDSVISIFSPSSGGSPGPV